MDLDIAGEAARCCWRTQLDVYGTVLDGSGQRSTTGWSGEDELCDRAIGKRVAEGIAELSGVESYNRATVGENGGLDRGERDVCLLYTSPSPRDRG